MDEITKEDLDKIRIEIERSMTVLAKLQRLHREITGKDHVMPVYLGIPKHLIGLI